MTGKQKDDLSYIYELAQFSSFNKLCEEKRLKIAEQILKKDASDSTGIAVLQGQYYALEYILLEIKKIHKEVTKDRD